MEEMAPEILKKLGIAGLLRKAATFVDRAAFIPA